MVQIRSAELQAGHWNAKGSGEGCGKCFSFSSQTHTTAALFRSGFIACALWVTRAKSSFSEHRRTPQDQHDLAPASLGNRFPHQICIRDFLAIRSFNLWSFFCSIRYRKYLHSTHKIFLQFLDSRPLNYTCADRTTERSHVTVVEGKKAYHQVTEECPYC